MAPRSQPHLTIVVCGFERLGDAVLATGALERLARARPDLRLLVLTSPHAADVFETSPAVAAVIAERARRGALGRRTYVRRSAHALARAIRRAGDIPERTHVFALRDRAPYREIARRLGAAYLPRDILGPEFHGHQSTRYAQAFEVLGLDPPKRPLAPILHLTREDVARARLACEQLEVPPERLIVLQPGVSDVRLWPRKRPARLWPESSFATLADALQLQGYVVAVNAIGAAERMLLARIRRHTAPKTFLQRLAHMPPRAFAALLAEVAAFITVDTGPMHLGAATGARMVALFGPSDPALTGPVSRSSTCTVLQSPTPAQLEIPVPLVVNAVRKLLR